MWMVAANISVVVGAIAAIIAGTIKFGRQLGRIEEGVRGLYDRVGDLEEWQRAFDSNRAIDWKRRDWQRRRT